MWPIGSAPDVDGAPPLWRIHRSAATGCVPGDRAADDRAGRGARPGCPTTAGRARPGTPAASTGTVLAHWPVHDTATTRPGSTTPDAEGPPGARRGSGPTTAPASWVALAVRARASVATGRCSCQAMVAGQRHQAHLRVRRCPRSTARTHAVVPVGRHVGRRCGRAGAAGQASPGIDCWASIISPIIIRMNSSASSVIPPATPP